jgi:hypothetical protein
LQGLLTGWAAARPRRCRLRLVRGRGEHGSAAPSNVALLAFGIVLLRLVLPWTVSDFRAEPTPPFLPPVSRHHASRKRCNWIRLMRMSSPSSKPTSVRADRRGTKCKAVAPSTGAATPWGHQRRSSGCTASPRIGSRPAVSRRVRERERGDGRPFWRLAWTRTSARAGQRATRSAPPRLSPSTSPARRSEPARRRARPASPR